MKGAVTQQHGTVVIRAMVILLACAVLPGGCGGPEPGPEEQLRLWVKLGTQAVEARERHELAGMISEAYADARGNSRDDIEILLRAYFFRQHSIKLLTSIDEVRLYGDSAAEIDLTVGMAGSNDGIFGFSADAYRFALELERNGGEWQLIAARWSELGDEPH